MGDWWSLLIIQSYAWSALSSSDPTPPKRRDKVFGSVFHPKTVSGNFAIRFSIGQASHRYLLGLPRLRRRPQEYRIGPRDLVADKKLALLQPCDQRFVGRKFVCED
jgi:hypothetical protein